MLEQLTAKNGINPDLFAIFSPSNELLFTIAIRALINADSNERTALARMDAEEKARREADAG